MSDNNTDAKITDSLKAVREFHEVYNCLISDGPDISCDKTKALRLNLLQEELNELKQALDQGDIVETLDALVDLQYVLDGAFLAFGLHDVKHEAFEEVHRSNMSKLGEDGRPIYRESDGKVLKGPHYFKPDLAQFIEQTLKENNVNKNKIEDAA